MKHLDFIALFAQVLRVAVPYVGAATGGVLSERAGTVDLALEGKLLVGAFGGAVIALATGSAWAGVLGGLVAALLLAALQAIAAVWLRADSVVTGVAINMLAIGATRLLLQGLYDSAANSPRLPALVGESVGLGHPLLWLLLVGLALAHVLAFHTPLGLRLTAAGEAPEALHALGVDVRWMRTVALVCSGVLAGLGGVWLVLEQRQYTHLMSGGRGFVAIAAVIVGRWRPLYAALACLCFAVLETAEIVLQGVVDLPSQLLSVIPFVVAVVAVSGLAGRARPPRALS